MATGAVSPSSDSIMGASASNGATARYELMTPMTHVDESSRPGSPGSSTEASTTPTALSPSSTPVVEERADKGAGMGAGMGEAREKPREDGAPGTSDIGLWIGEGAYGRVHMLAKGHGLYACKLMHSDGEGISPVTAREIAVVRHLGLRDELLVRKNTFDLDFGGFRCSRGDETPASRIGHIVKDLKAAGIHITQGLEVSLHENGSVPDDSLEIRLVMELAKTNLADYLSQNKDRVSASPWFAQSVTKQILAGLFFAHTNRIMHRDLKPMNVLIYEIPHTRRRPDDTAEASNTRWIQQHNLLVKIADFGLSRQRPFPDKPGYSPEVVTLHYRPIETFDRKVVYTSSIDIWSCGCILAEMALGVSPFHGSTEVEMMQFFIRQLGPIPSGLLPEGWYISEPPEQPALWASLRNKLDQNGKDLLMSMLDYVPARRISAWEALHHRYITQV
ncbi:hypothetical protein HK105_208388 [Polyrhizophydium stewartii]|uniref:Protein kinase domain-containing protein n=1 Tax=Polyrhizophydium stewartii TaxID=2732419 RepID=A0ABR4MXV3_9FUNG